jgi:hypothetical protein
VSRRSRSRRRRRGRQPVRWAQLIAASALFGLAAGAGAWILTRPDNSPTATQPIATGETTTTLGAPAAASTPPPTAAVDPTIGASSSSLAPTTTNPPETTTTQQPNDLTLVRYDMAALRPEVRTIAGIPFPEDASEADGRRITRFDDTGNGTLLIVDTGSGEIQLVSPSGRIDQWAVQPSDELGEIVDAAIGPDRVLYVSRSPLDDSGSPTTFSLVAYDLSTLSPTELRRWPTDWQCVESFCGELYFSARAVGPPFGTVVPYASTVIAPALAPPTREPITPKTAPEECIDTDTSGFFGALRDQVSVGTSTWEIEAVCSRVIEGTFATYRPQRDGSLVALVATQQTPADDERRFLVWLLTDGSRITYDVTQLDLLDATVADDRLLATSLSGPGNVAVIELTSPET